MSEQLTLLENIRYPRPDPEKPELQTRSIIEALPLEAMRDEVTASGNNPGIVIEAASDICTVVQQSLAWESGLYPIAYGADGSYVEKIRADQRTNCFGFALATSELLNRVEIKHYLAYMGGHVTTIIPVANSKRRELYMANADFPRINQFIGNTLIGRSIEQVDHDVTKDGRAVTKIDTARLILNSGNNPDDFTDLGRNEWLYYQKSRAFRTMMMHEDSRYYERRYQKIMTLYSATLGRKALLAYGAFMEKHEHDIDIGLSAITELAGIFPEVDARERHIEIRKLVRNLAQAGRIIDALDAVGFYCSSMGMSNDARTKGLESRLWESIAVHSPEDASDIKLAANGVAIRALQQARERERVVNPSAAFAGHSRTLQQRAVQLSSSRLTT